MKPKVVKVYTRTGIFTGKPEKYARVVIPKELIKVKGYAFRIDNYYDVPYKYVHNEGQYVEPLADPDFNLKRQFYVYRKKAGLLEPRQIRQRREALGLSQIDAAFLLGMSISNLSKIEHGYQVQSPGIDTRLRVLFCPPMLIMILRARIKTAKVTKMNSDARKYLLKDFRAVLKKLKDAQKKGGE